MLGGNEIILRKVKRRGGDRMWRPLGQDDIIRCDGDLTGDMLSEAAAVVDLCLLCSVVVIVRDHIVVDVVIGEISLGSVFIINKGWTLVVLMLLEAPVICDQ